MRRDKETDFDRAWRFATGRTPDILRRSPAAKVREIRKADKNATTKSIAERVGRSPSTIRRWERGGKAGKQGQEQLDSAVTETLVTRRAPTLAKRSRQLTVKANVTIGQDPPRSRKLNLGAALGVDASDHVEAISAAVTSGDRRQIDAAIGRAVAAYIKQGSDYPVQVNSIDWIAA